MNLTHEFVETIWDGRRGTDQCTLGRVDDYAWTIEDGCGNVLACVETEDQLLKAMQRLGIQRRAERREAARVPWWFWPSVWLIVFTIFAATLLTASAAVIWSANVLFSAGWDYSWQRLLAVSVVLFVGSLMFGGRRGGK